MKQTGETKANVVFLPDAGLCETISAGSEPQLGLRLDQLPDAGKKPQFPGLQTAAELVSASGEEQLNKPGAAIYWLPSRKRPERYH